MADFDKLAATAQRLINANGRTVQIVKFGNTPQDSEQPWRGQKGTTYLQSVTGKAAFVPKTQLVTTFAEVTDGVLLEGEYALFAADDDGGYALEDFDAIVDGGKEWSIGKTEIIAPADKRVLYMFEVKR